MQGKTDPTTPTPDTTDILVDSTGTRTLAELNDLAAQYAQEGYETHFALVPTSGHVGLYRKAVAS